MNRPWHITKQTSSHRSWVTHYLHAFILIGALATPDLWAQDPSGPFTPPEPILTPEEVTVNRVIDPDTGGVTVSLNLPPTPSVAEVCGFRGLIEPLHPVAAGSSDSERAALASAINAWLGRAVTDDFTSLETFATNNPESTWTPALLLNLGRYYYQTGYFSKALTAWEAAWDKTKDLTTPAAIAIADASVAEVAVMLARVGRKDELTDLLAAVSTRTFQDSTLVLIDRAREGLWKMEHRPEVSFRCGPYALSLIHAHTNGEAPAGFLDAIASPPEGFSMTELRAFAQSGLNTSYQVAKRSPGAPLILPSVVHWSLGHYGALIREQDGAVLLQDPTFGNDTWMTPAAIDAEMSGYFLVPAGPLPQGWETVDDAEAATVFGRGHSGNSDNDDTNDCSHQSGSGCGGGRGMAGYSFHTMLASLHITDIPVG
ncbi:MAG: cysteine peptidase family C39 domain-containing protein, partial [Verrucomicrobiia bacterium]